MKKASDISLPIEERLRLAAQEVLADEQKYCKGRLNKKQIEMLQSMTFKKKNKTE